jgi:hypothetical protein
LGVDQRAQGVVIVKAQKRFIVLGAAVLMVAALVLSACGGATSAKDFKYEATADGKGVIITQYTGKAHSITFPAKIEGVPVVQIGADDPDLSGLLGFTKDDRKKFTSFSFPDTITKIGPETFNYTSITKIKLPEHLTVIGNGAFANTPLKEISLPDGLKEIGASAFGGTRLTKVDIPETVTKIGQGAFQVCSYLAEIHLPDGLKVIPESLLGHWGNMDLPRMKKVNLPKSLQEIDRCAFNGCINLSDGLIIPPELKSVKIDEEAFQGCGKLSLKTRQQLKSIGYTGKF